MELFYFFLLLPILLILFKKYASKTKEKEVTQLPPGPWKLPILGSMHHLVGPLPHQTLWRLAKRYGGLMHLQLGEVSAIVISSPEAAKEIMKTHDIIFATRPYIIGVDIIMYGSTDLAGAPYGDYWRQLRKLCVVELFNAKRVQSFQLIREEEVYTLLHSISSTSGEVINLGHKILALSGDITARVAFGKKCKDKMRFMSAMKAVALLGGGFNLADYFPSWRLVRAITRTTSTFESLHVEIDKILDDIIKQHIAEKSSSTNGCEGESPKEENFLDVLLKLQETGYLNLPLKLDNIKAVIVDIFTGGTETSSSTMEWVMSELMKCPNAMKRVQTEVREVLKGKEKVTEDDLHELHYLKLVIKETLRLHPPLPLLIPRECRETCEILGYKVPKATQVIVNAWAIGRYAQSWDDAEKFMPERFEGSSVDFKGAHFEYLPFGAGRRSCPGMLFGLATMELPLALFLYHFDWELPLAMTPSELDMTENFGMLASKKSKLHLRAIPRVPLAF